MKRYFWHTILFQIDKESWIFDKATTFAKWAVNIVTDSDALSLAMKTRDAIDEAEKSSDPTVKKTLELLMATWTIQMWLMDRARVVARFSDWSGKSWAQAILSAFEQAKKWVMSIVLYSQEKYTPMSMSEYEQRVSDYPEELNTWVVTWLLDLYKKGSSLWFKENTWSNISLYCADRGWKTKIIWTNMEVAKTLGALYGKRKASEEWKLTNIIQAELKDLTKDNPLLLEKLTKHNLSYTEQGTIDAKKFIEEMNVTDIDDIPKKFEVLGIELLKDAKDILKVVRTMTEASSYKNISELWITNLDPRLSKIPFYTYKRSDILFVLPELQSKKNALTPDDPKRREIESLMRALISLDISIQYRIDAADVNNKAAQAKNTIKKIKNLGKIPSKEEIWKELDLKESQKESTAVRLITEKRDSSERSIDLLQKHGISDYSGASKRLALLENKLVLSIEEESLKLQLTEYIKRKNSEAQVFASLKSEFWKEKTEELFIETNRFISGDPYESYDFRALEKIAIMTDPESTDEDRALASMTPSTPPLRLSSSEEFDTSLSVWSTPLYAVSAGDGLIYIADKSGNPLLETKLHPYQVESVKKEIELMQSIGMESLIPLLPQLSNLVWGSYRVNGFDGDLSSGEIIRLIDALEKLVVNDGEMRIIGNIPERITHFRSRANQNGRLPNEYYEKVLREKWFLTDEWKPRIFEIEKKMHA